MRKPIVSLLLLAACGSTPPSTATVRSKLGSDLANVLHNAKSASDGSTANLPGGTASSFIDLGLGSVSSSARLAPLQKLLAPKSAGSQLTGDTSSFDPDAITQWLEDNIFTDANKIDDGIYRVPPELFCTTTSVDSLGNTMSSVDPDCVNRIGTAQLRVRVEDDNGGLRFSIQVDANHDEPLSFALTHTSLAITVDLDDATKAMISLASAFGEMAPNAAMAGSITGKLEILGDAHARASVSIDRAASIKFAQAGASLDGDSAYRFSSAQGQVFSVEGDANAPLLAVSLGLGETTAHIPGDAATSEPSTDIDLAGLTADASYTGGSSFTVDHISLGDKTTTVSKGGVLASSVDLNPNDGRELSATVVADTVAGTETLTVSPRLDLHTMTNHAVLGDTPPEYDVTHVLLDGALEGTTGTTTVRVASGTYSIETNPAQYGFTATAGQCVTSTDTYDSVTFNDYTAYSVGACQ